MSPSRKQNACSCDTNDELMAEFRRLRDETQPIHNNLMALNEFKNPRGDLSTDTSLLRELQLMRTEMKTEMKQIRNEMKENLGHIRMEVAEVKNNQEMLKNNQEELRKNQEIVKGSQEFVKNCLHQVKTSHVDLKKTVTDNAANLNILKTKIESVSTQIDKINVEVPVTNCLPTFQERISGKWKSTTGCHNELISLKLVDNNLIVKWELSDRVEYTLGVENLREWTVRVEGEKIVQLKNFWRKEFYLENGNLVFEDHFSRSRNPKITFTRIGDPDV